MKLKLQMESYSYMLPYVTARCLISATYAFIALWLLGADTYVLLRNLSFKKKRHTDYVTSLAAGRKQASMPAHHGSDCQTRYNLRPKRLIEMTLQFRQKRTVSERQATRLEDYTT